jgi:hypothetical protein
MDQNEYLNWLAEYLIRQGGNAMLIQKILNSSNALANLHRYEEKLMQMESDIMFSKLLNSEDKE